MNALDLLQSQSVFSRHPVEEMIDRGDAELHWTCDESGHWRQDLVTRRRAGNGWIEIPVSTGRPTITKDTEGRILAEVLGEIK